MGETKTSQAKIKAVAKDMAPAYIQAIIQNLPGTILIFDRFHITKLFNDKLSDLRRQRYHGATQRKKQVIQGTRWLLLKNAENLDPQTQNPGHPQGQVRFSRMNLKILLSFPAN